MGIRAALSLGKASCYTAPRNQFLFISACVYLCVQPQHVFSGWGATIIRDMYFLMILGALTYCKICFIPNQNLIELQCTLYVSIEPTFQETEMSGWLRCTFSTINGESIAAGNYLERHPPPPYRTS